MILHTLSHIGKQKHTAVRNKKEKYIERNKENASGSIRKFPVHFLSNDG